jgi:hypothetical protein
MTRSSSRFKIEEDSSNRRRLIRLVVLVGILIGVMWTLADLATRLHQRLGFDDVAQQVQLLEGNPQKVIQFVAEQILPDDYHGSLRGPVATLWAGAGSELDRAHLLMVMLQACGVEAQLARSGETWWVDSPALPPPADSDTADWRGTMIPSAASHRLELEITTGDTEKPLRAECHLAELSDDPILMEIEGAYLHLRRASQRKPFATCALPANCEEIQLLCRTLLPDDAVDFASRGSVRLFRSARAIAQADLPAQTVLCAVLVVLTAVPPTREDIPEDQICGRRLQHAVAISYHMAVALQRQAELQSKEISANPPADSPRQRPRYFLATLPPMDLTQENHTEINLVPL